MFLDWVLINTHLLPSLISFFIGAILLALAPLLYQIRTKKIIIINPITAIKEYSKIERNIMIVGAILTFCGLITVMVISNKQGYYYFNNGVPTLLKK